MTPEQIRLVVASHRLVTPYLTDVARGVHDRLIAADPTVVPLMKASREELASRLAVELTALVDALPELTRFRTRTEALGARHRRYGVEARHYRIFGAALQGALEEALEDRWTPETAEAWRLAFALTSQTMLDGAAAASQRGEGHA